MPSAGSSISTIRRKPSSKKAVSVEEIPQDPQLVRTAIEVLAIAQRLERIGDLSTSMAEQVIYLVEGRSVRHGQD